MVRPNINVKGGKKKNSLKVDLLKKFLSDKKFREKTLLNTANRWAQKYRFNGDITYSRLSDTKKSVHIKVDGKEAKSKYVVMGTVENPMLISGKAIAMATRRN